MAVLTYKRRKRMPKTAFAIPEKRAYPIDTRKRAANALSRVSAFGTASEKRKVRTAVCKRYPGFPTCKRKK